MNEREANYQLNVSRIFGVAPPAIYRAFTNPGVLAEWFPRPGWSMPPELAEIDPRPGGKLRYVLVRTDDPARRRVMAAEFWDAEEYRLLAWTKAPSSGGAGPARAVRAEFVAEPHRTSRLELREWPFTEAAEIDSRECWNAAFGRLDRVLADVAAAR